MKSWRVVTSTTLAVFLQEKLGAAESKSALRKRILQPGLCRVNGRLESMGGLLLRAGDVVEVAGDGAGGSTTTRAPPTTLFEDEQVRVIDKPAGWTCSEDNCRRLAGHCRLVHRLDKDTTGALLLAKTAAAATHWLRLFAERRVHKEYLAVVDGVPLRRSGVQQSLLCRSSSLHRGLVRWQSLPLSARTSGGLPACTRWRLLAAGDSSALVACQPLTGRTHQIRVHMAAMGHPILVDTLYGHSFRSKLFAARPLLHAFRLKADGVFAQAPLPADFLQALDGLNIALDASLLGDSTP